MGFLSKLFRVAPKSEWSGISLDEDRIWVVEPTKDHADFLRALPALLPPNSVVYLEGPVDQEVIEFLESNQFDDPTKVALGTIWPAPTYYHIPCSAETMSGLASIINELPVVNLCTHIHAYKKKIVLLEWHDAFYDDPIRLSKKLREEEVANFSGLVGKPYRSETDD